MRFCSYCQERNLDPYESSIATIVGFVESLRREGSWRFPTTKVCVSALSAFRDKVEGYTVFTHPVMHEYLEGAKMISVESTTMPDTWDPAVVLTALEGPPFEPLATADMKWVSGKVATLLLLTTAARVSEEPLSLRRELNSRLMMSRSEWRQKDVDLAFRLR